MTCRRLGVVLLGHPLVKGPDAVLEGLFENHVKGLKDGRHRPRDDHQVASFVRDHLFDMVRDVTNERIQDKHALRL